MSQFDFGKHKKGYTDESSQGSSLFGENWSNHSQCQWLDSSNLWVHTWMKNKKQTNWKQSLRMNEGLGYNWKWNHGTVRATQTTHSHQNEDYHCQIALLFHLKRCRITWQPDDNEVQLFYLPRLFANLYPLHALFAHKIQAHDFEGCLNEIF